MLQGKTMFCSGYKMGNASKLHFKLRISQGRSNQILKKGRWREGI